MENLFIITGIFMLFVVVAFMLTITREMEGKQR